LNHLSQAVQWQICCISVTISDMLGTVTETQLYLPQQLYFNK